jgi:hypothetical protein
MCRQQSAMLPYAPMPPMPPTVQPAPTGAPGFAQGWASGEYDTMISRYRISEARKRSEFFMSCMLSKGYRQEPE